MIFNFLDFYSSMPCNRPFIVAAPIDAEGITPAKISKSIRSVLNIAPPVQTCLWASVVACFLNGRSSSLPNPGIHMFQDLSIISTNTHTIKNVMS